ncbi:hypothetical protein TrST_g6729 [Triparma strigata]|uniref:Uncharacterized protein n=1 Tax=Triparma strigata TaxID=1606541 RepID=A0A9W7C1J2_9STRA|nr:hypothetical protein TrST_g6729 [Triparma strigata]
MWLSSGENNEDLVNKLEDYGVVTSQTVISALRRVDRGLFVLPSQLPSAYRDEPIRGSLPTSGIIHLSAPHMYRTCLDALELRKDSEQTFLNVGSGSNYLSAVVGCILGQRGVIHNVELEKDVMRFGKEKFQQFRDQDSTHPNHSNFPQIYSTFHGNGLHLQTSQTYSRIYIGSAIPSSSLPPLLSLLSPSGILVAPVSSSLLKKPLKTSKTYETQTLSSVIFASLRPSPPLKCSIPQLKWECGKHRYQRKSFREGVEAVLMCSVRPGIIKVKNLSCRLPGEVWREVFSFCGRDWFETEKVEEVEVHRRKEVEEIARKLKSHLFKILEEGGRENLEILGEEALNEVWELGNLVEGLTEEIGTEITVRQVDEFEEEEEEEEDNDEEELQEASSDSEEDVLEDASENASEDEDWYEAVEMTEDDLHSLSDNLPPPPAPPPDTVTPVESDSPQQPAQKKARTRSRAVTFDDLDDDDKL